MCSWLHMGWKERWSLRCRNGQDPSQATAKASAQLRHSSRLSLSLSPASASHQPQQPSTSIAIYPHPYRSPSVYSAQCPCATPSFVHIQLNTERLAEQRTPRRPVVLYPHRSRRPPPAHHNHPALTRIYPIQLPSDCPSVEGWGSSKRKPHPAALRVVSSMCVMCARRTSLRP